MDMWKTDAYKKEMIGFRKQGTVVRLEKPSRLQRARSLGYKAKQGFVMVRVKVPKGRRMRPSPGGGRKPKHFGRFFSPGKNKQHIGEEKAARKYPNMEVLNSYFVGDDGVHTWYEVILIDKNHPVIQSDKQVGWITEKSHTGRAYRGRTAAGKRSRAL